MRQSRDHSLIRDARWKRLASRIDDLAEKDERYLRHARDIAATRLAAATELYAVCRSFVDSINQHTTRGEVLLDPPEFSSASFQEEGVNLVQINVRGRLLQIEYCATPDLVSTEDFRVPYTLAGSVRAFNQELLDKDLIEEQLLFYTLEHQRKMWRFFDPRTYRSGPFDHEYLVSLMEQLV
ncbi:MAG: hypothetical protein ABSF62_04855 [Bryobacteraceae bacterium]